MTPELALWLLLALLGIFFSALFSGMETGLYTINRVRLTVRAARREVAAMRLRTLLNKPNHMLSTLLIGNNAANYAGSFGIAAMLDLYGVAPVSAILINVCILVPVLFVFGETLPKDLFRTHTDHWSYSLSGFLTWCARLLRWTGLSPLVEGFGAIVAKAFGRDSTGGALPGVARQRISHLIKEGVAAGVISESQTTIADRALAMRSLRVRDEMVPWRDVVTLPVDATPERRLSVIQRHPYSRLPVIDDSGRVLGVLRVLDALLEQEKTTRDLMQQVVELESHLPVRVALARLHEEAWDDGALPGMAIVVSHHGDHPVGIVTFKDLIEPLTGELRAW